MGSSVTRTLRRPRYRSQPQLAGGHRRWIPPPSWRAVIRNINASSCHGPWLPGLRVGRRWEAFKPAYKASTALLAQPVRDLTVAHPACMETGSVGLRTAVSPRDAQDRRYLVWPDFTRPATTCSRAPGPASTSTLAVPCYPGLASFVVLSRILRTSSWPSVRPSVYIPHPVLAGPWLKARDPSGNLPRVWMS